MRQLPFNVELKHICPKKAILAKLPLLG